MPLLTVTANVLAPLYGGFALGHYGTTIQPVLACAHYLVLLGCVRFLLRGDAIEDTTKKTD